MFVIRNVVMMAVVLASIACSVHTPAVLSAQTAEPQSEECDVMSIESVVPMVGGFSFSPVDDDILLYTKPVKGISQIFVRNLSSQRDRCITCEQKGNGPSPKVHTGVPSFLPDGQHFVLQVEMEEHPFQGKLGALGPGWFNNVWMGTLEGDKWWRLTDYPSGPEDRYGVLIPEISRDGKRIAWAQLYGSDPQAQYLYQKGKMNPGGSPWGKWQINIAELVFGEAGPHLKNIRSFRPKDGTFFETQGWSSNGRYLLFSSDIGRDNPHRMDLWKLDRETGEATSVTDNSDAWIEFGSFSPDGKKITFMSSECCDYKPTEAKKKLRTELYLMDSDGSHKVQLTHFNSRGYSESLSGGGIVVKNRWSADGRKVYFGLPFYSRWGRARGAWLKELTFAGPCGDANAVTPSATLRGSH